jgi:hypothetical protein
VALNNAMNPVIRGWSNYYRSGMAQSVFIDWKRSCTSLLNGTCNNAIRPRQADRGPGSFAAGP